MGELTSFQARSYPVIMKLETDIEKIEELSEANHEANWKFRSFLKGYDATIEELDSIVHELYEWISSEIEGVCLPFVECCGKLLGMSDCLQCL